MRAFGAIDAKVSSVLRSDIYRDLHTPQRPSSHASISSFHNIYPREPEILIHQGPTNTGQKPFCWDQFEQHQNNYYSSLLDSVKETISEMTDSMTESLERGSVGQDDEQEDDLSVIYDKNQRSAQLRGLLSHDKNHGGEGGEGEASPAIWNRHPSIKYNHYGQPNCFDYDWVMVPPVRA
jgi:hypothetical protein